MNKFLLAILAAGVALFALVSYHPAGAAPSTGLLNPNVTQANIKSTICVSGWTTSIRPPQAYTENLKRKDIKLYGYSDTKLADYQADHTISLEEGGNPTSTANIWPEPITLAKQDDKVENQINSDICSGRLTLIQGEAKELQLKVSHGYNQALSAK